MNIFVINSGSSSIKYQLFEMPAEKVVCSGLVERIGLEEAVITHKVYSGAKEEIISLTIPIPDHGIGLKEVVKLLTDEKIGVIRNPDEIQVVGHRVVHGGESFAATSVITESAKAEIKKLFPLAPLHNPSNYLGIEVRNAAISRSYIILLCLIRPFTRPCHQKPSGMPFLKNITQNWASGRMDFTAPVINM